MKGKGLIIAFLVSAVLTIILVVGFNYNAPLRDYPRKITYREYAGGGDGWEVWRVRRYTIDTVYYDTVSRRPAPYIDTANRLPK